MSMHVDNISGATLWPNIGKHCQRHNNLDFKFNSLVRCVYGNVSFHGKAQEECGFDIFDKLGVARCQIVSPTVQNCPLSIQNPCIVLCNAFEKLLE